MDNTSLTNEELQKRMMSNIEDDEDDYVDLDDEVDAELAKEAAKKPAKKNKGKSVYAHVENSATKQKSKDTRSTFGEWHLGELKKEKAIEVHIPKHDIPYKNQKWPVRERDVIYYVKLVDTLTETKRYFTAIYGQEALIKNEKLVKAGKVRFYKIVTFESLPSNEMELGVVSIGPSGKIDTHFREGIIKSMKIYFPDLEKNVLRAIDELVIRK